MKFVHADWPHCVGCCSTKRSSGYCSSLIGSYCLHHTCPQSSRNTFLMSMGSVFCMYSPSDCVCALTAKLTSMFAISILSSLLIACSLRIPRTTIDSILDSLHSFIAIALSVHRVSVSNSRRRLITREEDELQNGRQLLPARRQVCGSREKE